MVNDHTYADFVKCYDNKDFKSAASVVYGCLRVYTMDKMILDPLYKSNLESLLTDMHNEGIKICSPSVFNSILIKIHGVVITSRVFNISQN